MLMNSQGKSEKDNPSFLEVKLKKLEEMLVLTEDTRLKGHALDQKNADQFLEKVEKTIAEIDQIDHVLASSGHSAKEEKALQAKIRSTIQSLVKAHLNLVASIQAQQAILGNKIAHLKKNKDLLDTYHPHQSAAPMLIDSDL